MPKVNPQVTILHPADEQYPPLLREIPKPPARLYVRGNVELLRHSPLIAIVGTRRATDEGLALTKLIMAELNRSSDLVTVSGLAFGIDAAVAEAAVQGQRPTIAVLASSVEEPTPTAHEHLAEQILAHNGCLVSEYPPKTPAHKSHFPARNRIIAGLAQATLVVEAGEPSGALITAYSALNTNRDVLAVPGSPFNASAAGTNSLLKRGATLIRNGADVLDALNIKPHYFTRKAKLDDVAALVLKHLSKPRTLDQLVDVCTMAASQLTRTVAVLELEGRVTLLPDNRFVATQ